MRRRRLRAPTTWAHRWDSRKAMTCGETGRGGVVGTVSEENWGASGDSSGVAAGRSNATMVAMSYPGEGQRQFRIASPGAARVLSQ
jgi:hypothetical protein